MSGPYAASLKASGLMSCRRVLDAITRKLGSQVQQVAAKSTFVDKAELSVLSEVAVANAARMQDTIEATDTRGLQAGLTREVTDYTVEAMPDWAALSIDESVHGPAGMIELEKDAPVELADGTMAYFKDEMSFDRTGGCFAVMELLHPDNTRTMALLPGLDLLDDNKNWKDPAKQALWDAAIQAGIEESDKIRAEEAAKRGARPGAVSRDVAAMRRVGVDVKNATAVPGGATRRVFTTPAPAAATPKARARGAE